MIILSGSWQSEVGPIFVRLSSIKSNALNVVVTSIEKEHDNFFIGYNCKSRIGFGFRIHPYILINS